jgi:hypothetical protein
LFLFLYIFVLSDLFFKVFTLLVLDLFVEYFNVLLGLLFKLEFYDEYFKELFTLFSWLILLIFEFQEV